MVFEGVIEVRYEFRAVVGEYELWWFWQELAQSVESDGGVAAGCSGSGESDGEAGIGLYIVGHLWFRYDSMGWI